MQPPRKPRYTIGRLMVWIAVVAGVLGVPRFLDSQDRTVTACVVGVLATFVLLNASFEMVLSKSCPACTRGRLRRLARHWHYYRCSTCRARFKRFGFGPWLDASGPDDAARYRKPTEAGNWTGFAAPEKLDDSTSGLLLRSKRSRDLPGEIKRRPHHPGAGRRFEEAERKVRKFLAYLTGKKKDRTEEDLPTNLDR